MASIRIDGLTKVYPGDVTAIDALDLTVQDGSFFALLGPSGCGKTTLLRTIAGLEAATGGSIGIGERDVTALSPGDRNVAMVFQDYALFPHMTVTDNIAYPLRIRKVGRAERAATLRPGPATSRSPTVTVPASGSSKPAISRRRVVLPQPEGPSSAVRLPEGTCRSTPVRTGVSV